MVYKLNRRRLLASVFGLVLAAPTARAWFVASQLHGFNKQQVPAAGAVGGDALVTGETDALGIDFTYHTNRALQMQVYDTGTPANAGAFDPYSKLTYTAPSLKLCQQSDGVWRYGNHNLLIRSQQFDNAAWTQQNLTVSADATTAPDGTATADSVTLTAGNAIHNIYLSSAITTVASGTYAFSVFAKKSTHRYIVLSSARSDTGIDRASAVFDLDGGGSTATQTSASTFTIVSTSQASVGSGWYLLTIVFVTTSTAPTFTFQGASAATGNTFGNYGDITWNPAGTEVFYLWGAQVKRYPSQDAGGYTLATGYIATSASAKYDLPYAWSGGTSDTTTPNTIAIRGTPTTGSATNGNNITLSLPAGLQENDVVIVGYAMNAVGTGGTSSGGWTQIGANVGATTRIQIFRKVMGASPDSSIVLTGTGAAADSSSAIAIAFSNVDTTTPEDGVSLVSATGSSTNPDPGSITPTTTGAVAIAYAATSLIDTTGTAGPTGYSNFTQVSSNDNNDTTSYLAWKSGLTGGVAENPAAFTGVSTAAWVAYTIVLRPSSTTVPGTPAGAQGILIEEQRTNLLTRSDEFDNAAWTKSNTTISANAVAAPDGTTTADTITASAGNAVHNAFNIVASITSDANYAHTVFVKKGTHRYVNLSHAPQSAEWIAAVFDLDGGGSTATQTATGATSGTIVSTSQQDAGNGWYRLTLVGSVTDVAGGADAIGFAGAATGNTYGTFGDITYNAAGTETIHVWRAQRELGSFATSPIHTIGATVTRAVDSISLATSSYPHSATAGTMVVSFTPFYISGNPHYANLSDGTSSERIAIYGDIFVYMEDGGSPQLGASGVDLGSLTINTQAKVGMAWAANDVAGVLNGGSPGTDASATLPTVTTLRFGIAELGNNQPMNGYFKQFTYLSRRATNTELQTRTS